SALAARAGQALRQGPARQQRRSRRSAMEPPIASPSSIEVVAEDPVVDGDATDVEGVGRVVRIVALDLVIDRATACGNWIEMDRYRPRTAGGHRCRNGIEAEIVGAGTDEGMSADGQRCVALVLQHEIVGDVLADLG